MGFRACQTSRAPRSRTQTGAGFARQVDDFLQTIPTRAPGDEDAFERASRAQGFGDGVDTDQNGQTKIIPCCGRRGGNGESVAEPVGEVASATIKVSSMNSDPKELLRAIPRVVVDGSSARYFAGVVEGSLLPGREVLVVLEFDGADFLFAEPASCAAMVWRDPQ